ncbi:LRR receptor-like serine/threonine-protein kinase GSO1-like [Hibiscus syriacus]|uniref:LRR receptor-like serine/threonine-protein kinase GSO1-like n=1 Tax=Hibiscus syriacus TaxID=106335 RepID=A0A6A3BD33_HIBSY|nr:LRR receptor-like serine/threonine-protein kinase GSO1-like [Hibiscus syriacus]
MGNCLRRHSSTEWAGDDWGTSTTEDGAKAEEKGLVRNSKKITSTTAVTATTTHEVKVKITKKQLEELLGRVDMNELSVQQVLAQLINVSNQYDIQANQRSWRPKLQSIPEVN